MNRPALAAVLENIRNYLQSHAAFLLSGSEREDYLRRTAALLQKAQLPGEVLYVGIVGGTGVGKSTLINALAREHISNPGDRRPETHRAVVYRHKETLRGLEELIDIIRENDSIHEIDTLRYLLLIDLPDFDSFETNNRKNVLKILPKLDSIVWVVSPEKYGDAAFYDLVSQAIVHQDNFTFILNKVDEFFGYNTGAGLQRIKEVMGDFTFRLKHEAGILQPRVFSISSSLAINRKSGMKTEVNEFEQFRDSLMVKREAKEVASVKTRNLVEETRRMLNQMEGDIQPNEKKTILDSLKQIQLEFQAPEISHINPRTLPQERDLAPLLSEVLAMEDWSIRPVKWLMRWLSISFPFGGRASRDKIGKLFESAAQTLAKNKLPDLERVAAIIDSELILAFGHTGAGLNKQRPEQLLAATVSRMLRQFSIVVDERIQANARAISRFKRFGQRICLFLPLAMLTMKLAGSREPASWCAVPTLGGFISAFITFGISLFSSEGLIGLAVLVILQILFIYLMAARRLKRIDKESKAIVRTAIADLAGELDLIGKRIRDSRQRAIDNMQNGLNEFENLQKIFVDGSALTHGFDNLGNLC